MKKLSKTSKIIIACSLVFVLLIIFIYFAFFRKPKEKLMSCTMTIDNYESADIDVTINVHYTNYVDKLEGKINYKPTDDSLKENIDTLKTYLTNYYKNTINGSSVKVNVSSNEDTIVVDYSIDINEYKMGDYISLGVFSITEDEKISVNNIEDQVLKSGGSCVRE